MPIIEDSSHSTAASPSEAGGVLSSFFMSYGTARRRSGSSPTPNGPLPSQGAASSREPHLTRESSDDDRLSRHTEVSSYLRLKRLFSNVDLLSAVYRSLLPVPVWICYFVNGPGADYIPTYYLSVKLLNLFFLLRAIVVAIGNTLAGRTVPLPFSPCPSPPMLARSTADTPRSRRSSGWTRRSARSALIT
jgi:hypothetical protein